uniref:AlNc14C857G12585 protein n=1 Tax=Albugo laibachii Nc14 TaxID=890382 RepID=F0X267_9STRA|nr:AlNc14C857G12585 [Albugo laibachii Nc14]|eukprot:CCA27942.1 AlNc14C857G12585 [Albugo laibachii Nc14]
MTLVNQGLVKERSLYYLLFAVFLVGWKSACLEVNPRKYFARCFRLTDKTRWYHERYDKFRKTS